MKEKIQQKFIKCKECVEEVILIDLNNVWACPKCGFYDENLNLNSEVIEKFNFDNFQYIEKVCKLAEMPQLTIRVNQLISKNKKNKSLIAAALFLAAKEVGYVWDLHSSARILGASFKSTRKKYLRLIRDYKYIIENPDLKLTQYLQIMLNQLNLKDEKLKIYLERAMLFYNYCSKKNLIEGRKKSTILISCALMGILSIEKNPINSSIIETIAEITFQSKATMIKRINEIERSLIDYLPLNSQNILMRKGIGHIYFNFEALNRNSVEDNFPPSYIKSKEKLKENLQKIEEALLNQKNPSKEEIEIQLLINSGYKKEDVAKMSINYRAEISRLLEKKKIKLL